MKTTKRTLFFAIVCAITTCLNAQVGTWRTHFVYGTTTAIEQTPNKIFALANGSLYSVDKRDKSIELYSKISGLNSTNIVRIGYNEQEKTLVVVYSDSNIDLITEDGIFNLPDLAKKNISGSKVVNSIYMNGKYAYLATDFGIVVLNLASNKREFSDTYVIGANSTTIPVASVTMSNDSIYAASGIDIYRASKSEKNLASSSKWSAMTNLPVPTYYHKTIVYWSGRLYAFKVNGATATTGNVYRKDDGKEWTWTTKYTNPTVIRSGVRYLGVQEDRMLMATNTQVFSYNNLHTAATVIPTSAHNTSTNYIRGVVCLPKSVDDEYWLAAGTSGLVNLTKNEVYKPSGPASKDAQDIYTFGDKVFAINTPPDWGALESRIPVTIMIYGNNEWTNVTSTADKFSSITSLVADPRDNSHFFASTWRGAIYEFVNNAFSARYNATNSLINGGPGGWDGDWQLTYGLTYDNEGENLWFINGVTTNGVKILKRDGTWEELYYRPLQNIEQANKIFIDSHNNKWVNIVRPNEAVFVFNENGTFNNATDDKTRLFSMNSSERFIDQDGNPFFSAPRCFVEDKDGKIWIGTDAGPIIVENPTSVFTSNRCTRIKVPRNDGTNLADYLLDNTQVTAIAVDGDNRKWIATSGNGVFLVSANGTEIIEHFTTENSSLLSDDVSSLTLSNTGELFITNRGVGISSYQTNSSEGASNNTFGNVYAYPNPVTENYNGVISIAGLLRDSNVKIADISGNIVYETTSRGGLATWDGKNKNGQNVSTGIYLVLCSNADATETVATKILIIKR